MIIDIIIPTFNRGHCLKRAIDSVYAQTYKQFNLYIVDDASNDDTCEIIKKFIDRENFFYILMPENLGVSAARNKGIKASKNKWIAFLDSDDEWLSHKLKLQVDYINAHPEFSLVHGEEIWYRNSKRVNPKKIHKKSGGDIFQRCLKLCLISPSAVIIKRSLIESFNGFDEEFIVCEDYDLWLKITAVTPVGFVEIPVLNKYGGHDDQLSSKYFAMDYYRIKSIYQLSTHSKLNHEKKRAALEELLEKARILILGYLKHNNIENLEEVRAMESWGLLELSRGEELSS